MARKVALSAEDCQRFAALVDSLDVTQKVLADSADVGQPWLSYLLRGQRLTNVDATKLDKLATDLASRVTQARSNSTLAEDAVHLALKFLARFTSIGVGVPSLDISPPGGPLPASAVPYVARKHDGVLLKLLQTASTDIIVWGPAQCGKSTALALLERRARELGTETAWVDAQQVVSNHLDRGAPEIDATVALAISELLQIKWELGRPKFGLVDSIQKLNLWLVDELLSTASRSRLLIFDDLAYFGTDAALRWTKHFVRHIANCRATLSIRMSIAVGATHQFDAKNTSQEFSLSSSHHWGERVDCAWFSPSEVRTLLRTLKVNQATDLTEDSAVELFEVFKGQPYLTHAAAVQPAFWDTVRNWTLHPSDDESANRVKQQPWYRRHLAATRLAMFGPTYIPTGDEHRKLLVAFLEACTGSPSDPRVPAPEHQEFFLKSKLISSDGLPTLAIYRLFAEELKGMINGPTS